MPAAVEAKLFGCSQPGPGNRRTGRRPADNLQLNANISKAGDGGAGGGSNIIITIVNLVVDRNTF